MEITIYLFRHGETDWNALRKLQGHSDIPLNDKGREQARELGKKLKNIELDILYTSDLVRASETAEIALFGRNIVIEKTPLLRETHLGLYEGKFLDDILKSDKELWEKFFANDPTASFPEGETKGETQKRIGALLDKVIYKKEHQCVGISTHGAALASILHAYAPSQYNSERIHNCSLYKFEIDKNDGVILSGPF